MKIVTKKSMEKQIKEECWNLDYELVKWLNVHLKVYKNDASRIVDLEYDKFKYKKKEYTQLEIIDRLIEITDFLLGSQAYDYMNDFNIVNVSTVKTISARKNEMYDLLKLVHWNMCW